MDCSLFEGYGRYYEFSNEFSEEYGCWFLFEVVICERKCNYKNCVEVVVVELFGNGVYKCYEKK